MPIPFAAIAAGSAIAGLAGGLISSNANKQANRQAYNQQVALNEQMHHLNSFQNLRNEAKLAGLNPYLAMQGASGTSSSSSSPEVRPVNTPLGTAISGVVNEFSTVLKTMAETRNIDNQAEGHRIENVLSSTTLDDKAKVWELQAKMDEKRDKMLGIDTDYHGLMRANEYAFTEYQNATQRSMALNLGLQYQYNSLFGSQERKLNLDNMRVLYDKTLSDIDVNSATLKEISSRTKLNDAQSKEILDMLPYLKAESSARAFAARCAGMLSNSYRSLNEFEYAFRTDTRSTDIQQKKNNLYESYWHGKSAKEMSLQETFNRQHQGTTYWHNQVSQGIQDLSVINSGVQSWFTFGLGQERQNTYQQQVNTYRWDVYNRHR